MIERVAIATLFFVKKNNKMLENLLNNQYLARS